MWHNSHEETIRRLKDDLYRTRRAIVTLLPPILQDLADTYYGIETWHDACAWEEALVEAVIDLARPHASETPYSGPRSYCPLCRRGSSGPYVEGFIVPGGLRQHLLGEGNAHACEVLTPVLELARDYWRPRLAEADSCARAAAEAEKDRRRQTEDLYIVDPRSAPVLRDESLYGSQPRDDSSLDWAMKRLHQLGFVEVRNERTQQFTKDFRAVVVYADPRKLGRLNFSVFRREQVEKPKSRRRWLPDHASFHLLDSWKYDLNKKFEARVESAKQGLATATKRHTS